MPPDDDGRPANRIRLRPNRVDNPNAPLDDREKALACILTDISGIDIAEFAFKDYSRRTEFNNIATRCYRVRPYQWHWFRCPDPQQLDAAGRSVGKSERVRLKVAAFPFNHRGQEYVLIAPLGKHLDALTQRVEPEFARTRLIREMIVGGSTSTGINHRPFRIAFQNGSTFYTRLPGYDGAGVKGIHPIWLTVDEAQDVNERTWAELPEVVRWELDGAMVTIHGVTNGVRSSSFHKYSYSGDYTKHRYTAIHRPNWGPEEKAKTLARYNGSEEDPDYLRNVLGEPGATANRIFMLEHLERSRDDDEGSYYNTTEYFVRKITPASIADAMPRSARGSNSQQAQVDALLSLCDFPEHHLVNYEHGVFWAGMDVGLVSDPSEIVVAVQYEPNAEERRTAERKKLWIPEKGTSLFKILCRIQLKHITDPLQEELLIALMEHYRPRAFSMDATGLGLPMWQSLQARAGRSELFDVAPPPDADDDERVSFYARRQAARGVATVIKGYNFSAKLLVDLDPDKLDELRLVNPNPSTAAMIEAAGIHANTKDRATDVLRAHLLDVRRLRLPDDDEFVSQMNGQQVTTERVEVDARGKRRAYSSGVFHLLDAMRMLALGWSQERIEGLVAQANAEKARPQKPVLDHF